MEAHHAYCLIGSDVKAITALGRVQAIYVAGGASASLQNDSREVFSVKKTDRKTAYRICDLIFKRGVETPRGSPVRFRHSYFPTVMRTNTAAATGKTGRSSK